MNRIGIVTFSNADNYGAVLQAFALQYVLTRFGAGVRHLAMPKARNDRELSGLPPGRTSEVLRKLVAFHGRTREAKFAAFRQRYLAFADMPPEQAGKNFDLFLSGSDQVWNNRITGGETRYLLDFAAPEQRYSYAASFGYADFSAPETKARYRQLLGAYRQLSLREKSDLSRLTEIGVTPRLPVRTDLDPVLLLTGAEWRELFSLPEPAAPRPVTAYFIQKDSELQTFARELAAARGVSLNIFSAGHQIWDGLELLPHWGKYGPEDFLQALAAADCVVSNSFHALAFALLFHRPFRLAPLQGKLAGGNTRLADLLALVQTGWDSPRPDWARIDALLAQHRENSLKYLRQLCGISAEGRP